MTTPGSPDRPEASGPGGTGAHDRRGARGSGAEEVSGTRELQAARRHERQDQARRLLGLGQSPGRARRPSRWLDDIRPQTPSDVRLLLPACVAWALTAALLDRPTWVLVLVASAGVVLTVASARWSVRRARPGRRSGRSWVPVVGITGVVIALTLTALVGHRELRGAGTMDELAAQRASVRLTAEVVSDPRVVGGGAERAPATMVRLRVLTVQGRGSVSRVSAPILVFGDERWTQLRWGQRLELAGRLKPAEPGGDVVASVTVRGPPRVVGQPDPVLAGAEHVRAALRAAVDGVPEDAAGLVPGLVIGDTSLTPPDLTADMTEVQMSHLSAVSGSNVSIVLAALIGLCSLLGLPRRLRPVVALIGLAGFVVLARPEPSVIRAAVMGAVGLLGVSTSRRRSALPALGAAIVVLLCYDPWLARSYGFALSSLATLGLLVFATPWGERIGRVLPHRIRSWGPALAIPVAAQVACGPVTIMLQPSVSLVGVPANLAAAPFVGPTTVLGIVTAVVAVVSVPVAHVVAWAAAVPAWLIARVARVAADVPYGAMPWPDGGRGALLLALLTLVLVVSGPRLAWWTRARPLAALAVVVLGLSLVVPVGSAAWPVAGWRIVVCDVGQGDGIALSSGPGRAVVVDVGPADPGIRPCLSRLGIDRIDAVVLSHFHDDHVGGLEEVLDGWPVGAVLVTATRDPAAQATRVDRLSADHHLRPQTLVAGDRLAYGDVSAEVVAPTREIREGSVPNNASLVLLADVGGTTALLTGDAEPELASDARTTLSRLAVHPQVDVLKVAHHGSAKQDPLLLADLDAPLALISVGLDNDYGQPAASALTTLQRNGFHIERTDESGDLAVLGHGAELRVARRGR
ncbi:ComEC/Rec2 family competence protein [Arsenicicoccus sp. UBA7492]|uniref:ComEC/Rec2 family competence protein n=1 Tax=Arsenicicoccus sp. UBA7492 TaxID=1946057 RepID=UPI002579DFEF|nr:ComEC/Rec2 family competence protein [Arsenicicoccus sp. UBA7492]